METELNREKKWLRRDRKSYIAIAQILVLYYYYYYYYYYYFYYYYLSCHKFLSPLLPSSTNSYSHRLFFMFHSEAISVLHVMFPIQLSIASNVFLALPFTGQTAVVSARTLTLTELNLNYFN